MVDCSGLRSAFRKGKQSVVVWGKKLWESLQKSPGGLAETAEYFANDEDLHKKLLLLELPAKRWKVLSRFAAVTVMTLAIVSLTFVTWRTSTKYANSSIEELAFNLRAQMVQGPLRRLQIIFNATLESTVTYGNLADYVMNTAPGGTNSSDQAMYAASRNVSWAMFYSQTELNAVTLIHENGVSQGYEREMRTNKNYYTYSVPKADIYSPLLGTLRAGDPASAPSPSSGDFLPNASSGAFQWYRQEVNSTTGQGIAMPDKMASNDLVQDYGGVTLLGPNDVIWHAAVHEAQEVPMISCGFPVRNRQTGTVVAVAGVSQDLISVSGLIRNLVVVKLYRATIFLTNSIGLLLASSTSSPLTVKSGNGLTLMSCLESPDPIIRSATQWLQANYISLEANHYRDVHVEDVLLLGKRFYIDTFVVNDRGHLPLVGIICIPRSAIFGEVDSKSHRAVFILFAMAGCFFLMGGLLAMGFLTGLMTQTRLRQDITSHLNARRKAEATSSSKSQFLANLSHELRTPMAAVIGLLDVLLTDDHLTSGQAATVDQIKQCSKSLLRLLNNILDLSKVEAGKLQMEEKDFNLRHELENLVELFAAQCSNRHLEIVLDLDDDIPYVVRGDSTRTVQVFANIISNSLKFTQAGHILIRGRCTTKCLDRKSIESMNPLERLITSNRDPSAVHSQRQHQKIRLSFEVDDTGCGIDPQKWTAIFQNFVQADLSTTRTHGGTGLGLCIVKSLVQNMGGKIKVSKKDGPGTMFKFYLYLKQAGDLRVADDILFSRAWPRETLENVKVLFSTQGVTGRLMLSKWMTGLGFQVATMSNWEDTVAALEEPMGVELAILDIALLPSPGDLEILEKCRQRGVRFGWLLNDETSNSKSDLMERGYSVVANKPLYKSKLLQVLKKLLEGVTEYRVPTGREAQPQKSSLTLRSSLSNIQEASIKRNSFSAVEDLLRYPFEFEEQMISWQYSADLQRYPFRAFKDQTIPWQRSASERPQSISSSTVEPAREKKWPSTRSTGNFGPDERSRNVINPGSAAPFQGVLKLKGALKPDLKVKFQLGDTSSPAIGEDDRHAYGPGGLQIFQNEPLGFRADEQPTTIAELVEGVGQVSLPTSSTEEDEKIVNVNKNRRREKGKAKDPSEKPTVIPLSLNRTDVRKNTFVAHPRGVEPINPRHSIEPINPRHSVEIAADAVARANPDVTPEPAWTARLRRGQRGSIETTDALKGVRVILAEDIPVLQKVATIMLEKASATVTSVDDGLQAVNALTRHLPSGGTAHDAHHKETVARELKYQDDGLLPFDIVLMDCQMPNMDGYTATKTIRAAEKGTRSHIPIVALTAHAMLSDQERCLEVGMDHYLTKPIEPKLLISTIVQLLEKFPSKCV